MLGGHLYELVIVLIIALVIFGPKRLPELGGSLGKGIREFKDATKEIKNEMDSIQKKISGIEESLHQVKAKSGQDVLNYPIKLDDKLSSVYNIAASGYGAPAKQVLEAYREVSAQVDEQLNKLAGVISNDLPALNKLIREKSLPVISIKK